MNEQALNAVYLFIAELMGYKQGTVEGKLNYGYTCYSDTLLPDLSEEHLHEVIWLERLYAELDKFFTHRMYGIPDELFHWSVPIELDCSGSILSFIGALLGDRRMLEATNAAGDANQLRDPWHIEGLSRKHVKTACTPIMYGSSQPVHVLWKAAGLSYTLDQLKLMNHELQNGMFGTANKFKEFIINNCNPQPTMNIHTWNDKYEVTCNRHKRVGEIAVQYDLYDTESGGIRRITHVKTKAIPDLEGFRTYFPTCLIHGLDGQVMDTTAGKCFDKYGFALDIHDAIICSPMSAIDVRTWYPEEMDKIYANRKEILTNYFRSIGIKANAMPEWEALMATVDKIDSFKCRGAVLK